MAGKKAPSTDSQDLPDVSAIGDSVDRVRDSSRFLLKFDFALLAAAAATATLMHLEPENVIGVAKALQTPLNLLLGLVFFGISNEFMLTITQIVPRRHRLWSTRAMFCAYGLQVLGNAFVLYLVMQALDEFLRT